MTEGAWRTPEKPRLDFARNALLLDVDGTLLEIAPTPWDVVVPFGLIGTLAVLRNRLGGALAILSGRSIASIDALFAPELFVAAGCHGAEMRMGDGANVTNSKLPGWVHEIANSIHAIAPGALIEDKQSALSIHYRLIPKFEGAILALADTWRDKLAKEGFALLPGKFVIDIKPAAVSKGTAVRSLMAQPPFAGRVPVFAGDDLTDQEVLAVLPEFAGIGISVGRPMTGAEFQFGAPRETRAWLASQLSALTADDGDEGSRGVGS